ncbi:MAG: twin-arginine translocase TatA/TatE family subunit [Nitrososphaeraceae archaeon]
MVLLGNYLLQVPGGIEWVIIIAVIILLFFGVKKIPELARNIGKASAEYKKARIAADREIQSIKDDVCMNPGRGKLEDVANTLGIDCSSMTDEELRKAIDTEINKKKTV